MSFTKRKRYRRYGGYRKGKGKGKVGGQYIPGRSRGYLRTAGYYGRYQGRKASEQEAKFLDVNVTDAVVGTAGAVQTSGTINVIPQGVTESERVGRKCCIKAINWRYEITLPEGDAIVTPEQGDVVRQILFLDTQCNGATAAVTDILESAVFQSFNNLANKGRFRILMDRFHQINYKGLGSDNAGVISQAKVIHHYDFFKKCDIPIEYDNSASTGVISTIRTNNLGVLSISAHGVAGMDGKFRLRFTDG